MTDMIFHDFFYPVNQTTSSADIESFVQDKCTSFVTNPRKIIIIGASHPLVPDWDPEILSNIFPGVEIHTISEPGFMAKLALKDLPQRLEFTRLSNIDFDLISDNWTVSVPHRHPLLDIYIPIKSGEKLIIDFHDSDYHRYFDYGYLAKNILTHFSRGRFAYFIESLVPTIWLVFGFSKKMGCVDSIRAELEVSGYEGKLQRKINTSIFQTLWKLESNALALSQNARAKRDMKLALIKIKKEIGIWISDLKGKIDKDINLGHVTTKKERSKLRSILNGFRITGTLDDLERRFKALQKDDLIQSVLFKYAEYLERGTVLLRLEGILEEAKKEMKESEEDIIEVRETVAVATFILNRCRTAALIDIPPITVANLQEACRSLRDALNTYHGKPSHGLAQVFLRKWGERADHLPDEGDTTIPFESEKLSADFDVMDEFVYDDDDDEDL
jgi:hypothetical protein